MERYLRVNLLGPGRPSSYEKRIYKAVVSQRLRNTALRYHCSRYCEKELYCQSFYSLILSEFILCYFTIFTYPKHKSAVVKLT